MPRPTIALIIPLGDSPFPVDPGFGVSGGHPSQPIYHPGHPDHGLPAPEHPIDPGYGRPIYHPGHPDHGLPSRPGVERPDNSLPTIPGLPDNSLPEGPGSSVPPTTLPIPTPPPQLAADLVVAVWAPGQNKWVVTAWDLDVKPGHGLPPTASPKTR